LCQKDYIDIKIEVSKATFNTLTPAISKQKSRRAEEQKSRRAEDGV
jgi:hypothetical protein